MKTSACAFLLVILINASAALAVPSYSIVPIGLNDAEYAFNSAVSLNEAGQATRYASGSTGQSAWFYNGTTTVKIGLYGAEYTRNDGIHYSNPGVLMQSGQVLGGLSYRYNGGSLDLGQSVWRYDGTTTVDIGLTGVEHTRADDCQYSAQRARSESGQVLGYSKRYNMGSADLGESVWLNDGTTTKVIGFVDAVYTRDDGYKYSIARELNEAGQVAGDAYRFNGGNIDLGRSVWLYDGTTTTRIGLNGAEHTRNDGYRRSFIAGTNSLNNAGQVVGYSERYSGANSLGNSAWFYNGTTTVEIGPSGPEYIDATGSKVTLVNGPNQAGQVVGISYRYDGNTSLGQDAWFYDPTLDQTFVLRLSTRSDGFAKSGGIYLGEDGLILGTYTLFDALDNDLGIRAFYFTVADGLHDLGLLVDGGLSANGWEFLAASVRENSQGQILGYGNLASPSDLQMAFLLTLVVPEPSAVILMILAAAVWCLRRGRAV